VGDCLNIIIIIIINLFLLLLLLMSDAGCCCWRVIRCALLTMRHLPCFHCWKPSHWPANITVCCSPQWQPFTWHWFR